MIQKGIPFHYFRGGTSKGPYFLRTDLPTDREKLTSVLISVIGAGDNLNIDGIGGGNTVSTKVAILSQSTQDDVDIDYLFAQVSVDKRQVDYGPTCGNILVGVGPAAIELGLVQIAGDHTTIRICAVNTGAIVESVVETQGGYVNYQGSAVVDGVPGSAAPIRLRFLNVVGSKTGKMFPTGNKIDLIAGVEVSCIDVAMPMMIARAKDFGITGYESRSELNESRELFNQLESIRLLAGKMMGLGDCQDQVIPKIGLLSPARGNGHFSARYFMPWTTHPTLAVTGSQCLAACALSPGTVAEGLVKSLTKNCNELIIEHIQGSIKLLVDYEISHGELNFESAGLVRTARLIAKGQVFVPGELF